MSTDDLGLALDTGNVRAVQRVPDLSKTSLRGYDPGRSVLVRYLWMLVQALIFLNPVVTSYGLKAWVLRRFGAEIGRGVVIKPQVHIKYPWHLRVGDNAWLGERCWIDNFVRVEIGNNACVSQGAYLCTGNHDWAHPHMDLVVKPITVEDGAWVAAFARVAPGLTVARNSIVGFGSVLVSSTEPDTVYFGAPAVATGSRVIRGAAAVADASAATPA